MSNILTLEQIQRMSTDDIIKAYQDGYTLEGSGPNIPPVQLQPLQPLQPYYQYMHQPEVKNLQTTTDHYTWTDAAIITTAILVSSGITAFVVWRVLESQKEKLLAEVKETAFQTVTQGASIAKEVIPVVTKLVEVIGTRSKV